MDKESRQVAIDLVSKLSTNLEIPVTCKIRVQRTFSDTLDLCEQLIAAGCAMLAVHGRTKAQIKMFQGDADWGIIRRLKSALRIPVIANGGVQFPADVARCLEATGADGVMVAEGIL